MRERKTNNKKLKIRDVRKYIKNYGDDKKEFMVQLKKLKIKIAYFKFMK